MERTFINAGIIYSRNVNVDVINLAYVNEDILYFPTTTCLLTKPKLMIMYIFRDHVQRMDQERLPRIILKWCPPGRRGKGRPRNSKMQEIRWELAACNGST